jgi:hypothetical protein
MRTNTKKYRALIRAHILAGVYDYAGPDDDVSRARHIWAMFDRTYNYPENRQRTPNTQERVAEWLAGLPLNIAYSNGDIWQLAEEWHGESISESRAEKIITGWFNHAAFHLLGLWQRAGIDPHMPGPQGAVTCYA